MLSNPKLPIEEYCRNPLLKLALLPNVRAATRLWLTWATFHSGPEEPVERLTSSWETGRSSEKASYIWTRSSVRTVEGFSSSQTRRPEIHSTAECRWLRLGPQPRPVLIVTISLARPEFGSPQNECPAEDSQKNTPYNITREVQP